MQFTRRLTDVSRTERLNVITQLKENEIRPIFGYEDCYGVTADGRIWSFPKFCGPSPRKGCWLKQYTERTGYKFVILQRQKRKKIQYVHVLVAKNFLSNGKRPRGKQVNHKDGNKPNNRIQNLEWVTPSQNIQHSFAIGTSSQVGSKNAAARLDEQSVHEIRAAVAAGKSQRSQAKRFSISPSVVHGVVHRNGWKHV